MVIITGQVPTPAIGLDAFQECDTVGITRPIVKHNFLVKDVRDLAADDEEGLPHRPHRPSRPGAWSTFRRTCRWRRRRSQLSREGRDALVQPGDEGPRRPDPQGGAAAAAGQAPVHLHRRRRDSRQRVARAATSWSTCSAIRCTNTLMGLGAYPASDTQVPRHARHARHLRSQHGDAELRRAARVGARFDDRVIGNPKHFASRRTQDHPYRHRPVVASPSASRSTSRSSATSRTCCRT